MDRNAELQRKYNREIVDKKIGGLSLFNDKSLENGILDPLYGTIDPDQVLQKAQISRTSLQTLLFNPLIASPINVRFEAVMAELFKTSDASGKHDSIKSMRLLKLSDDGSPAHEFLYEQISPYLKKLVYGILNAKLFGYSVFEIVYNEPISRFAPLTIKDVLDKPFDWFEPLQIEIDLMSKHPVTDVDVKVARSNLKWLGDTFSATFEEVVDTSHKFFLTRHNATYDNPYGEAMLSRMYWVYVYDREVNKFWLKELETSAAPRLFYKIPDFDDDTMDAAAQALDKLLNGGVAAGVGEIKAISNNGNGDSFEKFKNFVEKTANRYFTGRAALSDLNNGSFAAQKSETENTFENIIQSDLDFCIDAINHFTTMIWDTNKGRLLGKQPEWFYDKEIGLHSERAERDKILKEANENLIFTRQYYENNYDLNAGDFELTEPIVESVNPAIANDNTTQSSMSLSLADVDTLEDANNKVFTIDTNAIKKQVHKFLTEERERIVDALENGDNLNTIFDDSQARNQVLFDTLYKAQTVKYGLDSMDSADDAKIKALSDQITNFVRSEQIAAFDASVIEDNTRKAVNKIFESDGDDTFVIKEVLKSSPIFSEQRANLIASTLNTRSRNMGEYLVAKMSGKTTKKWVSRQDARVRHVHFIRDKGAAIGIDVEWTDGKKPMRFPLDPKGDIGDIIECRCRAKYS